MSDRFALYLALTYAFGVAFVACVVAAIKWRRRSGDE